MISANYLLAGSTKTKDKKRALKAEMRTEEFYTTV